MEIEYASSPGAELCPDCGCGPEPEDYDMVMDSALSPDQMSQQMVGIIWPASCRTYGTRRWYGWGTADDVAGE